MTAERQFTRLIGAYLPALTVAVIFLLPAMAEAGDPRESSRRPSDVTDTPLTPSEPDEAPEPPSEYDNRAYRSGPPDTTHYIRPAVPEDYAPQGKPAIPPGVTVPAPDESTRKESADDSDQEGHG